MLGDFTYELSRSDAGIVAWDNVSNASLGGNLVIEARALELRFFREMGVFARVPREHQRQHGDKIIGVGWVDASLRDVAAPDYRSRMVGQEFATYRVEVLYAATTPLEALWMIWSYAVSGKRLFIINDFVAQTVMLKQHETCT